MNYVYGKVNVYWLVNSLIHNYHILQFYDHSDDPHVSKLLCEWQDDYYKNNKESLHKRYINFISINDKYIKVYLWP